MTEKVEKQEQRCKLKVKMNVYSVLMKLDRLRTQGLLVGRVWRAREHHRARI